ncbi:MAG: transposase zinc-binding domain-containing protein [Bdellovibrionota bacterium]|nr:MAG: transposase zinc-binding domain-containing protein [Bdellovibrionota bacterium]
MPQPESDDAQALQRVKAHTPAGTTLVVCGGMYTCRTWEGAKAKLQHYRRRQPEETPLYRIVYHGRDELPRIWEERFQQTYGVLRDEVLETFDEYLNCGLLQHGAARVYCDTCKHSLLVAFSCKKRGVCPSCNAKRAVKFGEHLYDSVLERVPHRHCGFTLPKRLRVFFRYDRELNTILFQAAAEALRAVLGTDSRTPALVLTLQTAGEALNFNPHLHGLLADGTFDAAGNFAPFPAIDTERMAEHFRDRVLSELVTRGLITDEVPAQILSQEHSGFGAWVGEPFEEADRTRFVARYIERGPLSLEKLSITDDIVAYTTSDGVTQEFDALEFLALLSCHIPKPYESVTRYYGWYSCRRRGERAKHAPVPDESATQEHRTEPSVSWAACMKRVFEIDPLECPRCKSQMRIVAFLTNEREILKIADALRIPHAQAPPKIPRPPQLEYFNHFPPDDFSA